MRIVHWFSSPLKPPGLSCLALGWLALSALPSRFPLGALALSGASASTVSQDASALTHD